MPQHIVLLGDSIFDNSVYTGGEPDVVEHLTGGRKIAAAIARSVGATGAAGGASVYAG